MCIVARGSSVFIPTIPFFTCAFDVTADSTNAEKINLFIMRFMFIVITLFFIILFFWLEPKEPKVQGFGKLG